MCGIFLAISKKKIDKKKCFKVLENLKQRGPDEFKYSFFNKDKIFLCNTILNITGLRNKNSKDLVESESKKFSIAFNGEIFNYKELARKILKKKISKSVSDTKILIDLHDKINSRKIPLLLNGMFAYIIYDKKKSEFTIVNDSQGEKNLYMFRSNNEIVFSSNISSILKYKPQIKINNNVIKNYFLTRHLMPYNNTCYQGIKVLNPGSFFKIKLPKFNVHEDIFENPVDWISEKKYKQYKKLTESETTKKIENLLKKQAKIMIPDKKFGCIFSGGIDSSLQSGIINSIKKPSILAVLHHEGKDNISKRINNFQKYFKTKIHKINITPAKYFNDLLLVYKISKLPVYTHSVVGIHQISKFFKKKKCKVYFSADGADELFGGYRIYSILDWFSKKLNLSPYSSINENIKKDIKFENHEYEKRLKDFKEKVKKKYSFLKNKQEINIQSNLFCDYFLQAVKVGNACNDLVGSNNSVEIRNIFIQKNVIKEIINIPAKYKINKKKNNENSLKIILKNLFTKYFEQKFIYNKQGFAGYPNEINSKSKIKFKNTVKLLGNKFVDKYKNFKDIEWKLININLFLQTIKKYK